MKLSDLILKITGISEQSSLRKFPFLFPHFLGGGYCFAIFLGGGCFVVGGFVWVLGLFDGEVSWGVLGF